MSKLDILILEFDRALRTLDKQVFLEKASESVSREKSHGLTVEELKSSSSLMRVNHTGEVCAQALYSGQSLLARDKSVRKMMLHSLREEQKHLALTASRLAELGSDPSRFNPLFYVSSFCIGLAAGMFGDKWSLGFIVETEQQVETHLVEHTKKLPRKDEKSYRLLEQMMADEVSHAADAKKLGGSTLPGPIKLAMKLSLNIMKAIAYRI